MDQNNFSVVKIDYYDVRKTLVDLFPEYKQSAIQTIESSRQAMVRKDRSVISLLIHVARLISRTMFMKSLAAHMILFVAKPRQ